MAFSFFLLNAVCKRSYGLSRKSDSGLAMQQALEIAGKLSISMTINCQLGSQFAYCRGVFDCPERVYFLKVVPTQAV